LKAVPSSTAGRRRRAWSESDDDESLQRRPLSRENSPELQQSDEEVREDGDKPNGNAVSDDED
jgi:RNA polymerase-associated protein CTR9